MEVEPLRFLTPGGSIFRQLPLTAPRVSRAPAILAKRSRYSRSSPRNLSKTLGESFRHYRWSSLCFRKKVLMLLEVSGRALNNIGNHWESFRCSRLSTLSQLSPRYLRVSIKSLEISLWKLRELFSVLQELPMRGDVLRCKKGLAYTLLTPWRCR